MRHLNPSEARKLIVSAQHLDHHAIPPSEQGLRAIMQTLRCLQLDPIRAVERPQHLVIWSRLGTHDRDILQALHRDRTIFEYWAHAASLVMTEDFPLHELMMRRYGQSGSASSKRLAEWVHANADFKQYVLSEIDRNGPMLTNQFEDNSKVPWASSGWSSGRSVAYMLDYLWTKGEVLVSKRDGLKRWWDLSERVLPDWTPAGGWSAEEVTLDAIPKALRGLGLGRESEIKKHFIENRYHEIKTSIKRLESEKKIVPVTIEGWPDTWYTVPDLLDTVEQVRAGQWRGRTTLLSPFDHLIRDRSRTQLIWDFYYRIEIYVPKAKREFGYYVLPILHNDRLIGRVDSKFDRKKGIYEVFNVYAEPDAPQNARPEVEAAIQELGRFIGADRVDIQRWPQGWQSG